MKVRIKDLEPNPFRDMENYPINPDKIEGLKNSINQTGFWDNILARKKDGKFQIAYGHHRLKVLQELFKIDDEVDIPIKELSDDMMIRVMILENDEDYDTNPIPFNEGIKQLWERLKQVSQLARNLKTKGPKPLFFEKLPYPKKHERSVIAKQMANWIADNYSEWKVYQALEHLKATGQIEVDETGKIEKIVDKEAVEKMPSKKSVEKFISAIKKTGLKDVKAQKRVAERIAEEEDFSEEGIKYEVLEEKLGRKEKKGEKKKEFEIFIEECSKLINSLNRKIDVLIDFKSDFDSKYYKNTFARFEFDGLVNMLQIKLKKLIEDKK